MNIKKIAKKVTGEAAKAALKQVGVPSPVVDKLADKVSKKNKEEKKEEQE